MIPIVKCAMTLIATFSEFYYSNENIIIKLIVSPFNLVKYVFNQDMMGARVAEIYKYVETDFAVKISKITETKLYSVVQFLSEHKVAFNELFTIPPEPLQLYSEKLEKLVEIPIPECHIGPKPVRCRLLSASKRDGMVNFTHFLW